VLHTGHNRCFNGLSHVVKPLLIAAATAIIMLCLTGCAVQVAGKRRPLVRAERIGGELELSMNRHKDETQASTGPKRKNTATIFEETLRLKAQGDVFHPRLMTYAALLGLGLNQQRLKSDVQSDNLSGTITSYGLTMNCLPRKPYPFSINTGRTESIVPRQFVSPLHLEDSHTAVTSRLRIPDWPMTISWSTNELKQDSDFANIDDSFKRTTDRLNYSLMHDFSERSHLSFRSDVDKLQQESRTSSREIRTDRHRLLHDFNFGSDEQHHLDSSASFVDKSSDFDSQTLSLRESLTMAHSQSFSTFYSGHSSKSTFASTKNETLGGTAGLNHRLYRNLLTTFSLSTTESEFGSGSDSTTRGGNLKFNYFRNNPWGKLTSLYSVSLTKLKSSGGTGTGIATDESHVFTDPLAVALEKRLIVTDTIVVTNSDGTELYTEGIDGDYTIRHVGDYIELVIDTTDTDLPNISDGQVLLVDYLYEVEDSRQEDSTNQSFRIAQAFKNGLSVYYYRRRRDREVDSSLLPEVTSNDFRGETFGTTYRKKHLSLRAQHSRTVSSENSVNSDTLSARNIWPMDPRTSLSAGVSQAWVESQGDNSRKTSLFKANGKIRTRLTNHIKLSARTEWRNEDSSDIGKTKGLTMGVALEYRYRQLSLETGWDSYMLDRSSTETNNSIVYIRLIRRF